MGSAIGSCFLDQSFPNRRSSTDLELQINLTGGNRTETGETLKGIFFFSENKITNSAAFSFVLGKNTSSVALQKKRIKVPKT